MKKNITIHLCGSLYNIDEDAYELLKHYTATLRDYFRRQEGGEEIANDIEQRIAELLDEKKTAPDEPTTIEHVQDIIRQVGAIEDIAPEANAGESIPGNSESSESSENSENPDSSESSRATGKSAFSQWFEGLKRRRYYRDSRDKILGGVLSGCSIYFGGNVLVWRLAFVLLSFGTIKALFALPGLFGMLWSWHWGFNLISPFVFIASLLAILFNSTPVLLYIVAYFFSPVAKSPEDRLRMKGREVNAQSLSDEVAESAIGGANEHNGAGEHNGAKGCLNGMFRIIALCAKLLLWFVGILMFIPSLIFAGMMVIAMFYPDDMAQLVFGRHAADVYLAAPADFWVFGSCCVAVVFIPAACALHAVLSAAGKLRPFNWGARIFLILLWILSVSGIFYTAIKIQKAVSNIDMEEWARAREEVAADRAAHIHDGHYFNDTEWEFFKQNRWTLVKAANLSDERYTYSGEYYTGDPDVRYLDAYSDSRNLIYHVQRTDTLNPGSYILSALVRCSENDHGAYIFAQLGCSDDADNGSIVQITTSQKYLVEIPGHGNRQPDGANHDNILPHGWTRVRTAPIVITARQPLHYGVSTDPDFTGRQCTAQWFSAIDFRLERVEGQ